MLRSAKPDSPSSRELHSIFHFFVVIYTLSNFTMQLLVWTALLPLVLAAPVIQPRAAQLIPGNYIVKLKDGSTEASLQNAIKHLKSTQAKHVYRSGRFKGFAAALTPQVLDAVSKLPEVRRFRFRAPWDR